MVTIISVNARAHSVDVDADTSLLWVLRDVLGLTGTSWVAAQVCGACIVHIDGEATRSCITPVSDIGTSKITTIEAIGNTVVGANIQKTWLDASSQRQRNSPTQLAALH